MTFEQTEELLLLLKAAIGELGGIREQIEKLVGATAGKPPSSKRGKS
jgi:hypothetical protein